MNKKVEKFKDVWTDEEYLLIKMLERENLFVSLLPGGSLMLKVKNNKKIMVMPPSCALLFARLICECGDFRFSPYFFKEDMKKKLSKLNRKSEDGV